MPAHRKPTHRSRILPAALVVVFSGSSVAFAVQGGQDLVADLAGSVEVTRAPSPEPSTDAVAQEPVGRLGRPSPTSRGQKERATRPTRRSPEPRPSRTETTEATKEPEGTPTSPVATPQPTQEPPVRGAGILAGTNAARADAGLPALDQDRCLAKRAQRHAERLASVQSLDHQDLQPLLSACDLSRAGENVAMNHTGPADMVEQWLNSPGHRANLLSSEFSLIGVGVAQARDGAWYGVQVFGSR